MSFSISALLRSQPAAFGFELNEFDPFFNYRATKFITENSLVDYFNWHDDMSWYPNGRDVSRSSQVMLHITAASLYPVFGFGSDLYDFTIIFPVVFGSLTCIVIFALVRVIGGTTAGLFASLFFSFAIPVAFRGTIGWFKSEPLGLFYGLLGIYFLLSGIKSNSRKIAFAKLIGAGIMLGFGLSSWGGIQFFIIPLGLFFFALPFLRKDLSFIMWAIPVFVISLILTSISFERPGISFITGLGGISLIGPTIFLVACSVIQRISKKENKLRNGFLFLIASVITSVSIIIINATSNFFQLPSFRYLNAINPFLTTSDPLVDSVAEHATTTTAQSFWFLSILMVFAGIGIWILFSLKGKSNERKFLIDKDMTVFTLIIGLIGVYVSSAFVRLELFASISIIILSSVGLSIITKEFFKSNYKKGKEVNCPRRITKISYVVVIIILLVIPTSLPADGNWSNALSIPPTILNGGTGFAISTTDWHDSMNWLKNNTPEDAVVAAWWDYGYWITTLAERASLADNATLSTDRIKKIAQMLLSHPDDGWERLNELQADYLLVTIAAQKVENAPTEFFLLGGGLDESKKQWFIAIAEKSQSKFLQSDAFSGTDRFWNETILGATIPYSIAAYLSPDNTQQSPTYQHGFTGVYVKDIKFPSDGDGPLKLVYASPSFFRESKGPIIGVFIYEVNKEYEPGSYQPTQTQPTQTQQLNEVAVISTTFGEIVIQFKEDVAPNTVENFKKLASSGFYDGTIFHRIVPGFVIQGGDPNTITGSRDTWGIGDPGYTINAEFSDIKHKKYIVSMARGSDINSAGSQFFIVLEDAPWLDGQYTVFGEVISGHEVIDKIASLETNSMDQPINPLDAEMNQVRITSP